MKPQFSQPKGSVSKETNKDSIARKFGCKKSEVLYAKPGSTLTGYKVIYDKVTQRSYALPSNLPAGATITSLTDGILVHNTGTVDLGELAVLREEFVTLVENFTSGFTIRVKNEVVSDGTYLYRWGGSLPKIVPPSSTPLNSGGIGVGKWVLSDRTKAELGSSSGAGMSGFDPFYTYPDKTVGNYLSQVPGSDNTGMNNSLDSFNAAILKLALKGGGVLHPEPGIYKISGGSVLLPSYVTLDLRGCELRGDGKGTNTLIASGWVENGTLIDITPEYGTGGGDGNGTHFVIQARVFGGKLTNAGIGIRGQRFNYGTTIEGVWFENSLSQGWFTTHSWGLKVTRCLARATCKMLDFVDWTEVSNNDFEGLAYFVSGYVGLIIGTGGYGGSYSCRIISNGFHQMETAIKLEGEIDDLVIESNHYERTVYHVVGDQYTKTNFRIKHNWMKANLAHPDDPSLEPPTKPGVIPMVFQNLKDSDIGPNRFTNDSGSTYSAHIVATGDECYGNCYYVGYKTDVDNDFSKIQMSNANALYVMRGSNNSTISQPSIELRSGSAAYTVEKYKASYNMQLNKIPLCDVYLDGSGNATVTTWFQQSDQLLGAFSFRFVGSSATAVVAGTFCYDTANVTINKISSGGSLPIAIGAAGDGRLTISFAQVPVGASITGWVKQL